MVLAVIVDESFALLSKSISVVVRIGSTARNFPIRRDVAW
jgi:hypothetical protein